MNSGSKQYGIGWLKFYVKWRFPLAFIFGALELLGEFSEASENGYFAIPLLVILFGFDIFMYIYRIVVYNNMLKMTPKGYSMNMLLLVLETLALSVPRALATGGSDVLIMLIVLVAVAALLWFLPNYIYFTHRKALFTGEHTLDQIIQIYKNNIPASAFPSDGKSVGSNKRFICDNCGVLHTGWYQSCPSCGAIGRMHEVVNTPSTVPDNTREAVTHTEPVRSSFDVERTVQQHVAVRFCRYCGQKLEPGSKFCINCGAKIEQKFSSGVIIHEGEEK